MTRAFCTLPNRLRNALEAEARKQARRDAKRSRRAGKPPAAYEIPHDDLFASTRRGAATPAPDVGEVLRLAPERLESAMSATLSGQGQASDLDHGPTAMPASQAVPGASSGQHGACVPSSRPSPDRPRRKYHSPGTPYVVVPMADCDGCPHPCGGRYLLPTGRCTLVYVALHDQGASLEEIAWEMHLTRERIRQIEEIALVKFAAGLAALEAGLPLPDYAQNRKLPVRLQRLLHRNHDSLAPGNLHPDSASGTGGQNAPLESGNPVYTRRERSEKAALRSITGKNWTAITEKRPSNRESEAR